MKFFIVGGLAVVALVFGWNFIVPTEEIVVYPSSRASGKNALNEEKTPEERIKEAEERASVIKGLYMTADVANDQGAGATRLRKEIIRLAEETEINGIVIDVKEVCGPDYNEKNLKKLLEELREKNIWAIARIAVSKDASQINVHPEWYLTRAKYKVAGDECARKKYLRAKPSGNQLLVTSNQPLWQDKRGGYWIDPTSQGAREYLLSISKKMADFGFDEIQFDYIRFPSDGDIENIIYPAYDKKTSKCKVMQDLFGFLHSNLKAHKPELILSADMFGYAAIGIDTGIGQCLETVGNNFDFVSFMVYPSHYYSGLSLRGIPELKLPPVSFNIDEARKNPGVVVGRSLAFGRDYFAGIIDRLGKYINATSTATTSLANVGVIPETLERVPKSRVKSRPWLEDFYHEDDKARGAPYGADKVRLQIDAAESVENHGWLLWNAANIYTKDALKAE